MKPDLITTVICDLGPDQSKALGDVGRKIAHNAGEVEALRVSGSSSFIVLFRSSSLYVESAKRRRFLKALEAMNPRVLSVQWVSGNYQETASRTTCMDPRNLPSSHK